MRLKVYVLSCQSIKAHIKYLKYILKILKYTKTTINCKLTLIYTYNDMLAPVCMLKAAIINMQSEYFFEICAILSVWHS